MDRFGLELTNNSKTGWAFSLPRSSTCINATGTCKALCYGNGLRYQSVSQKAKRERNFRTVELLLKEGGSRLLAQNLIMLIDQIKPADWFVAGLNGNETTIPWTLRIHDIGDFHSIDYINAWYLAILERPLCSFWFYTRSFQNTEMFNALTRLASLSNCQGWLSIDNDNYKTGIKCLAKDKLNVWKLALLQIEADLLPNNLLNMLRDNVNSGEVVSFPYHNKGRNVKVLEDPILNVCPAVTGIYKLQADKSLKRPCQLCEFCLP